MVTGKFSLGAASLRFFVAGTGGVLLGLLVGFAARSIHRRLDDPPVQVIISLLTPFAAYLLAERSGLSAVLATVSAGVYLGWHSPSQTVRFRLQALVFWETIAFLLNGFIFIMIGLQLRDIMRHLREESWLQLASYALLICATVVLVRIAWVFPATYLPRWLGFGKCARDPVPPWQQTVIVAWAGMRGVVSLAAALALPITIANGQPFPARSYILFLTFCVILTTLVLQGLSLPFLIRKLRVRDDGIIESEERSARLKANEAAVAFIEEKAREENFPEDVMARVRAEYCDRIAQLNASSQNSGNPAGEIATPIYQRLQHGALQVERKTIVKLRNSQEINDEALRRIQRDLDLAEARLTGG
jgi:CPA1 family monovalent cation:H+ antiporter